MPPKPTYTELEKRIKELEENEAYYRLIVDNSTDMISKHDSEGRFLYVSRSCESLFGYSTDELSGKSAYDFFHPVDMDDIRISHGEIQKATIIYTVSYRFKHKRGHYVWVETTSKAIKNLKTGEIEEIIAITRDITERKRAEGSLVLRLDFERLISEISSDFLRSNLEEIDQGVENALASIGRISNTDRAYVFLFREDGKIADNTHEWCAEGVEPQIENLKGVWIEKEFPWFNKMIRSHDLFVLNKLSELPREAEKEFNRFKSQGIKSLIVIQMALAEKIVGFIGLDAVNEERVWTNEHLSMLRLFGEVFANAVERKRIEEKLRISEKRWQFAIEGAGDGLWDWDASTNKVFFSPQWKAMLGYSENEVGDTLNEWDSRIHPDDKNAAYAELEEHFSGRQPVYQCEHRILCKDGSYKWILDRGQVIERKEDGTPKRVIGTHTDITARKEYEAEREKLISELQDALTRVKTLSGLLPICANCKKIRDDKGYWNQIELYIHEHSEAEFSHSICPDCMKVLYPDLDL